MRVPLGVALLAWLAGLAALLASPLSSLQAAFNAHADCVRVVTLVSPT